MNFLSHLYLSGDSEGLLIGNFIADSVKGNAFNDFPEDIKKGIILHRKIDTYTDSHPVVEESKKRLRDRYRKYAGVIVDVYYDHFLASGWNRFSKQSLEDYTRSVYELITKNHEILPLKSKQFTRYMLEHDILAAYAHLEGIERVMKGMARRTTFISNMEHSVDELREHYSLFETEFNDFFPQLEAFVKTEISG